MSNKATKITIAVIIVFFAIVGISILKPDKTATEEPKQEQKEEEKYSDNIEDINYNVYGQAVVKTKDGHQSIMIGD